MNKKYYESVDLLKIILLICMIVGTYTMTASFGLPILPMLSFAPGTFFLLYGYFVLRSDEELELRLKRSIKRAAIAFAVAAVVYFAILCGYCLLNNIRIVDFFDKKTVFDFFVLNIWAPVLGGNIWIVQAILYALIAFYFLNKWKLLKKYDMHIMILLFVIAILFGEGAGLIHFRVRNYTYISGNFLTRAMPYMLLGRILYKARFRKGFRKIKNWMWALIFVVGLMLAFIEFYSLINSGYLVYYSHLIGFIPMSIAIAMIALNTKCKIPFGRYLDDIGKAGFYSYSVVAQLIYSFLLKVAPNKVGSLSAYLGLFTVIVSLLLGAVYALIRNRNTKNPKGEELTDETAL